MVLADVAVEPGIVHKREVGPPESPVELIPRDADPGGIVVGATLTLFMAGAHDVEELGKFIAHPWPGIVLIGNSVDSQLADKCRRLWLAASVCYLPEGLSEAVGATPDRDIDWPVIVLIHRPDNMFGARRVVSFADSLHTKSRDPCLDRLPEGICLRPAGCVDHEVTADLPVGLDPFDDFLRGGPVAEPAGGRGDEALNIELVRVAQEPDHGLLIIGFVGDIGENNQARFGNRPGRKEQRGEEESDLLDHGVIENEIGPGIERKVNWSGTFRRPTLFADCRHVEVASREHDGVGSRD